MQAINQGVMKTSVKKTLVHYSGHRIVIVGIFTHGLHPALQICAPTTPFRLSYFIASLMPHHLSHPTHLGYLA